MSTPPDTDNVTPKQQTPPDADNLTPKPQVTPDTVKKMSASYFFVAISLMLILAIVGFSMHYISDLGQDILLQFEAIAETLPIPSGPADQPVSQTITVEVNRSSLLSADYLAVVLPILLTVAGAFIVFLGMNRLKMYDERIDSTRADLLTELGTMVDNRVSAAHPAQVDAIKKNLIDELASYTRQITDAKNEFGLAISDFQNQLDTAIEEPSNAINKFVERYNWLIEAKENKTFDPDVHTVFDAHKTVEKLRAVKIDGYVQAIQKIVNRVLSEKLSGQSADYHNLSAELARGRMYLEAIQILEKGLSLFPSDTDQLADSISYATKGGMINKAKDALEKLLQIDRRLWTWRCYSFCCDYYISCGSLDLALEMCDDCITAFPTNQHGYFDKANVVRMLNPGMVGIDESIKVLQSAIAANINCPQCSNELGEIYLELGKFEDALEAFNLAVLQLAIAQPGITESYIFYNRGSCYDRMFIRSLNTDAPDTDLLVNAHNDYVTALKLGELSVITKSQTLDRLKFLQRFMPETNETE